MNRETPAGIPCRKCLLSEVSDEALYLQIRRLIEAIPEEERCSEEEYRRRLDCCRACDRLLSGMCRACGCYAELRAARLKAACPDFPKKW